MQAVFLYFNNDSFKTVNFVSSITLLAFILSNIQIGYNSTLCGFLLYEISVGMLYPSYSKIKAEFLPSENRGTLTNIFKIPLNMIIIFLLLTMDTLFTIKQVL
jgi:hypothetical protein